MYAWRKGRYLSPKKPARITVVSLVARQGATRGSFNTCFSGIQQPRCAPREALRQGAPSKIFGFL